MAAKERQDGLHTLLDKYQGLRLTDVCDGMDALGMQNLGWMDPEIQPLWKDIDNFTHRVYGVAHTVRYVPTDKKVPDQEPEEFYEWMATWYRDLGGGPRADDIQPGDVIVADDNVPTWGFAGSANSLVWVAAGAVGVVGSGCRDSDELIKERIPVYTRRRTRTILPGRAELVDRQVPINCGGAAVRPGDIIVADGDGVVVVPQEVADAVADQAWRHANKDKMTRRTLYERAGLEEDWTVRPHSA